MLYQILSAVVLLAFCVLGAFAYEKENMDPSSRIMQTTLARISNLPQTKNLGSEQGYSSRSSGVSNTPSGYIMTFEAVGDGCDGNKLISVTGVGMEICYINHDENGSANGSIYYNFTGQQHPISMIVYTFDSTDCTGSTTDQYTTKFPSACQEGSTDSTGEVVTSYSFGYTSQSDPWKDYGPGLEQQLFDSSDGCEDNEPMGLFTFLKTDVCNAGHMLTECFEGMFTLAYYSDNQCQTLISEETTPVEKCYDFSDTAIPYPVDENAAFLSFGSLKCAKDQPVLAPTSMPTKSTPDFLAPTSMPTKASS